MPPNQIGRSAVMLEAGSPGPYGWYWGVRNPKPVAEMTEQEKKRREELGTALERHGLSLAHRGEYRWPQWDWLPRYDNWNPIVPELHDECEADGGPITAYYVDGILKIAKKAIPAMNEVEMPPPKDGE